MIQQVVSRSDAPKHFPDASGGFVFVDYPFGARSVKPALRCGGHFSEPEVAASRRTCASACASASTPQRTLPIWLLNQLAKPRDMPITNVVALLVTLATTLPITFAYRLTMGTEGAEGALK